MSQPNELTALESHTLAEAIFEAMEQGDHEAADNLADLAQAPAKVREILGQEGNT